MKTQKLVEDSFKQDPEIETLARDHVMRTMKVDPDGVLVGIKHWGSSIHMAFNDVLYEMAPLIMNTPEFRSRLIAKLKSNQR